MQLISVLPALIFAGAPPSLFLKKGLYIPFAGAPYLRVCSSTMHTVTVHENIKVLLLTITTKN